MGRLLAAADRRSVTGTLRACEMSADPAVVGRRRLVLLERGQKALRVRVERELALDVAPSALAQRSAQLGVARQPTDGGGELRRVAQPEPGPAASAVLDH